MYDYMTALLKYAEAEGFTDARIPKRVRYVVELTDQSGVAASIRDLEQEVDDKRFLYRMLPVMYTERTSGTDPGFLIDNLVGFGYPDPKKGCTEKRQNKITEMGREALQKLRRCDVAATHSVVKFWETGALGQFCSHLQCKAEDLDYSGSILFRYRNKFVHDIPSVLNYFESVELGPPIQTDAQCLLTGKKIKHLLNPLPKIRVPGLKDPAPLIFQNQPSVEHYGLPKEWAYPMERDDAINFLAIVQRLFLIGCPDPQSKSQSPPTLEKSFARISGSYSLGIWCLEQQAHDLLDIIYSALEDTDDERLKAAWQLFEHQRESSPLDSIDEQFLFILGIRGVRGQIMIRDWNTVTIASARRNLQQHYIDTASQERPFGRNALLRCSCAENNSAWYNSISEDAQYQMWSAILLGTPYPIQVVHSAGERFIRELMGGGSVFGIRRAAQFALLCGYLNRNKKRREKGEQVNNVLDQNNKNPAYLLGRLLAVGDYISYLGYGAKNAPGATLLETATHNPRGAHEIIVQKANQNLNKMRRSGKGGPAHNAEKAMSELIAALQEAELPRRFSRDDRYLIGVAYYLERRDRFERSKNNQSDDKQS